MAVHIGLLFLLCAGGTFVPEYGSGFSYRQLNFCRQFYRTYPITSALRTQFNWTQYKLLISISDSDKREYYELEAANNGWTARQNTFIYLDAIKWSHSHQSIVKGIGKYCFYLNHIACRC